MTPQPDPIRFKVYPEKKKRLFYWVYVWPDRDALVERSKTLYPDFGHNHETYGFCSLVKVWKVGSDGRKRRDSRCGEINFFREHIGAGIVSHEMTHAALGWAQRVGVMLEQYEDWSKSVVSDAEERYASAVGELVRQFYVRAHELGLY